MAGDAGGDATAKMFPLSDSPQLIRLISADGHEYTVREEVAFQAPTIVDMMKGPAEANGVCHLDRIPSHILSIIVHYLHYKELNPSATWLRGSPPPSFPIPSSLRIDACYAADFLRLVHYGPSTEHVRLISDDGHEFIVKKEIALQAGTIRVALSGEDIVKAHPSDGPSLRLISSDGDAIDLAEWGRRGQAALRGGGIWDLLNESRARQCFSSRVLRCVIHFLIYQKKYKRSPAAADFDPFAFQDIPEFGVPPELAVFLMATANFLQC